MAERELNEILNAYIERILMFISPIEVLLYGSQARGTATERSDIDVAVIVDPDTLKSMDMNFLQIETELYRMCEDIDWRIEPVLFEDGDDASGLLSQIKHHGKMLYKAA
jgi:predicted nucleotidyltransferase